jgi:DNA polymerase III epsilon subunit-like protein
MCPHAGPQNLIQANPGRSPTSETLRLSPPRSTDRPSLPIRPIRPFRPSVRPTVREALRAGLQQKHAPTETRSQQEHDSTQHVVTKGYPEPGPLVRSTLRTEAFLGPTLPSGQIGPLRSPSRRWASEEACATSHVKRKCGFVLQPVKPRAAKIPRAEVLNFKSSPIPMPRAVSDRLGNPSIIIGIDCETNDWLEDTKGHIGPFGWYTKNNNASFARIVQLGWAVGDANVGAEVVVKSALIQPQGYEISKKASDHHKITQDIALQNGRPLADVLTDFMIDVSQAHSRSARICAHHLEFDAGLVDEELRRCGLSALREEWVHMARSGYCTMNPEVSRWLKQCAGEDVGAETKKHMLGLIRTTKELGLPQGKLQSGHHDAAHDAQMTRLIYAALLQRAGSPQSSKPPASSKETTE